MIEHINLLDKVFYTYNKCVYEVTIVSKVYNRCNAVNIIFNDEIKPVNIKNLYYTNDEAYKRVLEGRNSSTREVCTSSSKQTNRALQ